MRSLSSYVGLVLLLTTGGTSVAQEENTDGPLGAIRQTFRQIVRPELDESGRLRLKRDHWELFSKRPSDKEKAYIKKREEQMKDAIERWRARGIDEDQIARMTGRNATEYEGIVKLVSRLNVESGGSIGFNSTSRSGNNARYSFSGKSLTGRLECSGEEPDEKPIKISVAEQGGKRRSVNIRDSDESTRILARGSGQLVLISREQHGVQVVLSGDDKPAILTADSFAELAREHADFLRDKVNPALDSFGISPLPVDAMLETEPPGKENAAETPKLKLKADELVDSEDRKAALRPLLRFRIVDGRLFRNNFFGNSEILKEELKRVRAEFKQAIDAAADRMREQGAPESQINELKSKLRGWEEGDENNRGRRGFGGVRILGGFGGQRETPGEMRLFNSLHELYPNGGSGRSTGGDRNYSANFRGTPVSGEIRRYNDTYLFKVADSAIDISVSDAAGFIEVTMQSDSGLLTITQLPDGPATALLIGGGKVRRVSGDDYTSMLVNNIDELRKHFFPLTDAVGISGLDPLSEAMTSKVVNRLKGRLPDKLDSPTSATDSVVFPLLTNKTYLAALKDRVSGDDVEFVQKRLDAIGLDDK